MTTRKRVALKSVKPAAAPVQAEALSLASRTDTGESYAIEASSFGIPVQFVDSEAGTLERVSSLLSTCAASVLKVSEYYGNEHAGESEMDTMTDVLTACRVLTQLANAMTDDARTLRIRDAQEAAA